MNKSNTLISINGKIGSGKDTVGNIIQYLTANDSSSDIVERIKDGLPIYGHHNSKWEIKKFAGKLKQIASLLTGIPVEMFEDQEFKKLDMGSKWGMTYREFLQKLGTDAMRDNLHKNIWVNALFADYRSEHKKDKQVSPVDVSFDKSTLPNWIITDMRFPNEMDAVKERKGITIKVIRQYSKEDLCKGSSPAVRDEVLTEKLTKRYQTMANLPIVKLHPSETALDDAKFDYEIINDGSIEDLIKNVELVLTAEGIL